MKRAYLLVFAVSSIFVCALRGQDAAKSNQDAASLLKSMMDATALDSAEAGSWHWKMDVTVYDFNGKNPKAGGIEVWRSGPDMRSVLSLDGNQLTTLRVGNMLYRSDGDPQKFSVLEAAFIQMLNPVPQVLMDPAVKLKLVQKKVGKAKLTCVEPAFTMPPMINELTSDDRLEFCALPDAGNFVQAFEANQTSISIDQVGTFRSKQVPLSFRISSNEHLRVDGKTTDLSPLSPAPDQYAVTSDLHPLQLPLEGADGLGLLMLVHGLNGMTQGAISRNAGGTVGYELLIRENGTVRSYTALQETTDLALNRASESALSHIIFRPYLINGIAVPFRMKTYRSYSIAGGGSR